jgi:nicotinamidase/pyrazinamidase
MEMLSGAAVLCIAGGLRPLSARTKRLVPDATSVLIVVDVQDCFISGALAVPHGADVVAVINKIAPAFENVVLTQDWHPPGHASFASSHPGRKPDSYSAFEEADRKTRTGLHGYLQERGIREVFVAGLATDFCVGRGIGLHGSIGAAWAEMKKRGIRRIQSTDIEPG